MRWLKSITPIFGQNASYGSFVTPRFVKGQWENDKSEIRKFPQDYWSVGIPKGFPHSVISTAHPTQCAGPATKRSCL
jgi:hypothetical protein